MNPCSGSKAAQGFFRTALIIFWLFALVVMDLPVQAAGPADRTAEKRTASFLESIRDQPGMLYAFLRQKPKGGDLHSHLSGVVFAQILAGCN